MSTIDRSQLRTKLRQVNMEYSALLRSEFRELRFGRMSELRAERRRLMAQLDSRDLAISSHSLRASNQQKGGAKVLQAAH